LWARRISDATTCADNLGDYPRLLTVEEFATAS
jgi:hypothetical protein